MRAILTLGLIALLSCVSPATPVSAEDSLRPARGPDPYEYYVRAARQLGAKGWDGSGGGNAERITLRIDGRNTGIGIELPPNPKAGYEEAVAALLHEQGWEPGRIRTQITGNGPIVSSRARGMIRALAWNRNEVRLDVDRLVAGLERLGGRPRFLAVRASTLVEWSSTPQAQVAGTFDGSQVGFYRLQETGNSPLIVRYHVFPRRLMAALASAIGWILFPVLVVLAARFMYRPTGDVGTQEDRWPKPVKALRYTTSIGVYVTLFFQNDVLRLVAIPIPGITFPFDSLAMWSVPFSFMLYVWAGAVWTLVGPGQGSPRKVTLLKVLAGGVGSVLFYVVIYAAFSSAVRSGNFFSGINVVVSVLVGLFGLLLLSLFFLAEWRLNGKLKKHDTSRLIPDDSSGRRELLRQLETESSSPEKLSEEAAAIEKIAESKKAFSQALQTLSAEEKSWFALANLLAFRHGGRRLFGQTNPLLPMGLTLVGTAALCWVLPDFLGLFAVFAGTMVMSLLAKFASKSAMVPYTRGQVDYQVAILLDDPERYVQVLRRLEIAENEQEGPKTELVSVRRAALERALRQNPPSN